MSSWSTDDLAAADRFAVWREWRASHIFGVTADLPRDERARFRAEITSRPVGDAVLVNLRSSPYRARRSWRDIARVQADSLCIYQQVAGPRWAVDDGRGARWVTPVSHIAIGYSDLPYATTPLTPTPFETRLIKIPLTPALDPKGLCKRAAPRALRDEPGLEALVAAYACSFFDSMAHLHGAAADLAVDTLSRLAVLACTGDAPAVTEGGEAAVAAGRLQLVRSFVAANLHRSDLSAESVASALRMSLRCLHRTFEPSGTSFARHVLQARVERAASLLAKRPDAHVLDIAFDCGFTGSSVFYRAFRQRYGLSPTDYRASLRAAAPAPAA